MAEPVVDDEAARPLSLSAVLQEIADEKGPERLTFTELAERLDPRAWGGLLVIFSVINAIPLPPGVNIFFAVPLAILSAQMALGRATPWFPARFDRRGVTRDELRRLIAKFEPIERRIERLFKPRLPVMTGAAGTRFVALICLVLALFTALPVVHIVPAAVILLFGVALLYRDGLLVIIASIAAATGFLTAWLMIQSGLVALTFLTSWLHHH
jgi:hypothetical protein